MHYSPVRTRARTRTRKQAKTSSKQGGVFMKINKDRKVVNRVRVRVRRHRVDTCVRQRPASSKHTRTRGSRTEQGTQRAAPIRDTGWWARQEQRLSCCLADAPPPRRPRRYSALMAPLSPVIFLIVRCRESNTPNGRSSLRSFSVGVRKTPEKGKH